MPGPCPYTPSVGLTDVQASPTDAKKGAHPPGHSLPHLHHTALCAHRHTHTHTFYILMLNVHTHALHVLMLTCAHTDTCEPCRCRKLTAQTQLQGGKGHPRPSPQHVFRRPIAQAPPGLRPSCRPTVHSSGINSTDTPHTHTHAAPTPCQAPRLKPPTAT